MKTKIFPVIPAIALLLCAFALCFTACGDGGDSNDNYYGDSSGSDGYHDGGGFNGGSGLNGTWYSYGNVNKYYFNNWNYEHTYNGNPYRKGTYTTTNDSMTMTMTHIGSYYISSYTWLESSTWYSRDGFKTAYLNYYRAMYRSQYQQTYDTYVANYGVATANSIFQSAYGTTNIDSIVDSIISQSQIEKSIDTSINQLYTTSTVAYQLSGSTLILGGVSLTRD